MASIFRTVKFEDLKEYKAFIKQEKDKVRSRNYKDEELLRIQPDERGNEEAPTDKEGTEQKTEAEPEAEEEKKEGEEEKGDDEAAEGEEEEKKDEPEKDDSIDDRVFVCLGKHADGSEKRLIWVMTINRTYDTITFWEAKAHKNHVLEGRIKDPEKLKTYLSPKLTTEEKEAFEKLRKKRKEERDLNRTLQSLAD